MHPVYPNIKTTSLEKIHTVFLRCKMTLTFSLLFIVFCVVRAGNSNDVERYVSDGMCMNGGSWRQTLSCVKNLVDVAQQKVSAVEEGRCTCNENNPSQEPCLNGEEPDCYAHFANGKRISGVYTIWPKYLNHSIRVFCNMDIDGGGWTVIQRRGDYGYPRRNFYETWEHYKTGFGDIEEDFWLGNEYIFALTNQAHMNLRIDLEDFDGKKRHAKYENFLVRSELEKYKMTLGKYQGDAGNSFNAHNNRIFITKDNGGGCANKFRGGWWYAGCHQVNLNGIYHNGRHDSFGTGVNWAGFGGYHKSMKYADMKIRPCIMHCPAL